jgi:hypothetical protein
MDFKADVRFFLLLAAGVVAAAWGFANAGAVDELTKTGTNGYISMVRGLEPPQYSGAGIAGGAGNFSPAATTGYGGAPSYYPGA